MKDFDIVAFIYCIIVVFMIVGCIFFIIRELRYNLKFTILIFISVVIGLGLICLYNYFKNF
ncbi:hypothetical protein FYJ54_08095 [Fusobacterium sp. FSA-380-WT-2B]|jgi:predicted RND superfamily exporter protein|nr:hypothetical protein [Fusobacterium sp. FSA-380-WT-2B]